MVNNERALNNIIQKPDIAFAGMVDFSKIGDSNSYGSARSSHSRTTEVTHLSEMDCRDKSPDKPSLAILLFFTVLNRGLSHVKGQTFKIISHPSKRRWDEK